MAMKRLYAIVLFLLSCWLSSSGQIYYSKTGKVSFISDAPLEKIEAHNNNSYVVFDTSTGNIEWSVLIKGFQFEKALMQDHFNENYMESQKFPKGLFKGTVQNMQDLDLKKDGVYHLNVKGELTLHGITKPLNPTGMVTVKNGTISAISDFEILVADYDIDIPKVVRDNVAKNVAVKVNVDLQKLN
jgi:hypothetical protein